MSEHSEESLEPKDEPIEVDPFAQLSSLLSTSRSGDEAPAFNVRLIAEVKSRPHLYDHTHEGYNVIPWRAAAWQEIADILDSSPESVKTRWKTLRDRFKKEDKKEKQTGKHSAWIYQKQMKFVVKNGSRCDDACADEDEQISPIETAMSFIEQEISRNDAASTSDIATEEIAPPVPKKARVSLSDGLLRPAPPRFLQYTDDEEDDMFARMIAARLSKLSAKKRDMAKIRMLSALYQVTNGEDS